MNALASARRFIGLSDDTFSNSSTGRAIPEAKPISDDNPESAPQPDGDMDGFLSNLFALVLLFNPPRPK
jgi:hypothetical protein